MTKLGGRTRLVAVAVAGALLTAGCIDFSVTKKTTGGKSSGPFKVRIVCTRPNEEPLTTDVTFNGPGTKKTDQILFPEGGTCTITEPESAGATSVTLKCDSISPDNLGITCTEKGNALEVKVPDDLKVMDQATVSLSVTNDFTPPPTEPPTTAAAPITAAAPAAAPAVAAGPTFTG